MDTLSRRHFIQATAGAAAVGFSSIGVGAQRDANFRGSLCFFSKHLPRMNARELGRTLKAMGFDGVDLTVRPGGHVDPKRVTSDLPPFVDAIGTEGLTVPMISTELLSNTDPVAQPTLETASRLKIPFYKTGYYRYKFVDVRKELEDAGAQLKGLTELSRRHGIRLGYHNHAGYIGGPVWDFAPFIEALDAGTAGYYFDVRHAVVEGGDGGWRTALDLVSPRLSMISLKDFFWEKTGGTWQQRHCPMGEGMVDWKRYFAMLAKARFHGPVSLHVEYEVGGATPAAEQEHMLAAVERDFAFVKARIVEAF
ncbi:MAG TPA: sugar phosphate isomerase/epimerase family protein [Vicinamibacterales bacterium]|nr:sugar phosphate isomerase/epimerase family protein [Vicinamibacterales bacterium]